MDDKKNGGPAFPSTQHAYLYSKDATWDKIKEIPYYCNGMTLLDYFAGQAMIAFIIPALSVGNTIAFEEMAKSAYLQAKAMLAEKEAVK